jgi:nitronate monooxygenase
MEDEGAFTSDESAFRRCLAQLTPHLEEVHGAYPSYAAYKPIRFEDQVQVLLDEKIPAFSFIFGIPSKTILDEFRRRDVVIMGAATTVDEA